MVHDLFDGSQGFAIDGGIKDSTHIRKLAAEMNSPMPALVRNFAIFSHGTRSRGSDDRIRHISTSLPLARSTMRNSCAVNQSSNLLTGAPWLPAPALHPAWTDSTAAR